MSTLVAVIGSAGELSQIEGLSQNRNAFAFILLLSFAALIIAQPSRMTAVGSLLTAAIIMTGSRAGYGALVALAIVSWWISPSCRKSLVGMASFGIALALLPAAILAAKPVIDAIFELLQRGADASGGASASTMIKKAIVGESNPYASLISDGSSNAERLASIKRGLQLFAQHPIFGAGLGAHVHETSAHGAAVVIHSTPVFILAEMGLFGLLLAGLCIATALRTAFQSSAREARDLLLLILVPLLVMGLVHEMLYQRAWWLLAGAALAMTFQASKLAQTTPPVTTAGCAEPTLRRAS